MEDLTGFILASFALVGSPGPATLSLAATGAAFGVRRGLAYLAGIEAGLVLIMIMMSTGLTGLVMALPSAAPVVTGAGAAYILYLAYRIGTAPITFEEGHPERHPSFWGGMFLSLVNPKAYASMAALFSGFLLVKDSAVEDALLKGAILLVILTLVDVAWLFAGGVLARRVKNPKTHRIINVMFAILLVLSVVFALGF
ncbi:MAG: LysE family translocator [Candidatus Lindowbacteria bacterium]|nr:LysE family translocator [Candidatus Lindowbacteria bacterium]